LESIAQHLTQDYPGQMALEALKQKDLGALKDMKTRLVLGKSLVGGSVTGDVFEGVDAEPIPLKRVTGYVAPTRSGLSAELGGPWAFYEQFWKAHDLAHVGEIFKPEVRVGISSQVNIPLLLHNDTADSSTFAVSALAPAGWGKPQGTGQYSLRPHETVSVNISVATPEKESAAQKVTVHVGHVAELSVDVSVDKGGLPQ
jgi:hypothetical protein